MSRRFGIACKEDMAALRGCCEFSGECVLGIELRPNIPATPEVTAPSFPDATEKADPFRFRKSLALVRESTGLTPLFTEVCGEIAGEGLAARVDTLEAVAVRARPGRKPDDDVVDILAGRNALRDWVNRADVGEPGGEARRGPTPFQLSWSWSLSGLAWVGGVLPISSVPSSDPSGKLVLVICAEAIDVVVSGGAVAFSVGVKLWVRMREGGRRVRTEGGRDDGAVLKPDIGCCSPASATTSRCCSMVAVS